MTQKQENFIREIAKELYYTDVDTYENLLDILDTNLMSVSDASDFIQEHLDQYNEHKRNRFNYQSDCIGVNPFTINGDDWEPDIYNMGIAPWTGDF